MRIKIVENQDDARTLADVKTGNVVKINSAYFLVLDEREDGLNLLSLDNLEMYIHKRDTQVKEFSISKFEITPYH